MRHEIPTEGSDIDDKQLASGRHGKAAKTTSFAQKSQKVANTLALPAAAKSACLGWNYGITGNTMCDGCSTS